jgi:hypothetical protein
MQVFYLEELIIAKFEKQICFMKFHKLRILYVLANEKALLLAAFEER